MKKATNPSKKAKNMVNTNPIKEPYTLILTNTSNKTIKNIKLIGIDVIKKFRQQVESAKHLKNYIKSIPKSKNKFLK